jgi:CheY-like chemotaxis protein
VGVLADPVRLEQMIVNLLGNAFKYTPADRAVLVRVAAQGQWAVLSVEDEGVGIAADVLPHIFELFVQSERSLDRSGGGLGIGLSLVKSLVELHGGRVEAHSDGPGKGSRFTLRLPRIELEGESVEPVVRPAGESARILLIEDNADAREMLGAILRLHGHQVDEAADGAKALELAARTQPDVMLVDIGLPVLDGYEVARRLRRMPHQPRRLIALTGYGMPEDRSACLEAGFDDHIVKPIDIDRLLSLIEPS